MAPRHSHPLQLPSCAATAPESNQKRLSGFKPPLMMFWILSALQSRISLPQHRQFALSKPNCSSGSCDGWGSTRGLQLRRKRSPGAGTSLNSNLRSILPHHSESFPKTRYGGGLDLAQSLTKSKAYLFAPRVKNSTFITELHFLFLCGGVSAFLLKMPSFTA